ncbi:MAG: hypothetical protein LBB48_08385 [Treponema sp.]|nr:hypothetical protein [Treponema sp.]
MARGALSRCRALEKRVTALRVYDPAGSGGRTDASGNHRDTRAYGYSVDG